MVYALTMPEAQRIAIDTLALVGAGVCVVFGVSCGVWLLLRIWP